MAKEPNICPYCSQAITSDQAEFTTQSGIHYHQECYHNLEIDDWVSKIEKKYPTTDAKLARIISQNNDLLDTAKKQRDHLGSIKTVVVLFMILVIAGIILQSCSALLTGY